MVQLYLENNKYFSLVPTSAETVATTESVFNALANGMNDYAVDKRGDVGSMVRTEAMAGYSRIYSAALKSDTVLASETHEQISAFRGLDRVYFTQFLTAVVKQATEKIDRMRGIAGNHLMDFLDLAEAAMKGGGAIAQVIASNVPEYPLLLKVKACKVVDWSSPAESFDALVTPLIDSETFQTCLLEGLVLSVGGMSSHVAKASLPVVTSRFQNSMEEAKAAGASPACSPLSQALVEVGKKIAHSERVVPPFYTTLNKLLIAGAIDPLAGPDLVTLLEKECKHFAKDVHRVLPLIPALSSLTVVPTCRQQAWMLCLNMVASRFPRARAQVGTELYTGLMMSLDAPDIKHGENGVNLQDAMDILAATQWDGTDAKQIRGQRDLIYPLLGLTKPAANTNVKETIVVAKKEDTSYKALVREAGY